MLRNNKCYLWLTDRKCRFIILLVLCFILNAPLVSTGQTMTQQDYPEFWVNKLSNPDKLIMNQQEIAKFNLDIIHNLPDTVYDLAAYPAILSKKTLVDYINSVQLPGGKVYINGAAVPASGFEALRTQTNLQAVLEQNIVRYGFTVRRADLRTYPTKDGLFESPDDWEFDRFQKTAVDPAEPLVILHQSLDSKWYYIQTYYYRGWLPAEDIAVAATREEWLAYMREPGFLIVTGANFQLAFNPVSPELSEIGFQMGAKIPLAHLGDIPAVVDNQAVAGNYVVILPVRDASGNLKFKQALIPSTADVTPGYLPYTRANIIKQAFKMQGQRYGWGGMFKATDCSGFIMNIYRTFGLKLPRNADEQENSAGKSVDLRLSSLAERTQKLQKLLPGATLHMNGHVMLYLGEDRGGYYIIHDMAAYGDKERPETDGSLWRVPVNQVTVSDLTTLYRVNGKLFLESLTTGRQFEY